MLARCFSSPLSLGWLGIQKRSSAFCSLLNSNLSLYSYSTMRHRLKSFDACSNNFL
jgi:hypothetical protein